MDPPLQRPRTTPAAPWDPENSSGVPPRPVVTPLPRTGRENRKVAGSCLGVYRDREPPFLCGENHLTNELLTNENKITVLVHDCRHSLAGTLSGGGFSRRMSLLVVELPAEAV